MHRNKQKTDKNVETFKMQAFGYLEGLNACRLYYFQPGVMKVRIPFNACHNTSRIPNRIHDVSLMMNAMSTDVHKLFAVI